MTRALSLPSQASNLILQIDHVGLAVRQMLVVHAVIGGQHQHAALLVERADIAVHHGVESIRHRRAGRGLVLHVIGGGEIHQVRPLAHDDGNPRRHDEFRQFRGIDVGHLHADALRHVGDAVVLQRRLVGFLRGKGDGAAARHVEPVAQQRAQLVLGGHHRDLGAGVVKRLHDGRRAQEAGVVHHHFLLAQRIEEVIARDAMHRRRTAGDDRQVVGIGEARDHRLRQQI